MVFLYILYSQPHPRVHENTRQGSRSDMTSCQRHLMGRHAQVCSAKLVVLSMFLFGQVLEEVSPFFARSGNVVASSSSMATTNAR